MADISKKYQEILEGLERNIKDPNELSLLKSQISELVVFYTDMINKTVFIEDSINKVDRNIRRLADRIENIEEDIYIDSDESENSKLEELGEDQMHDNDFEFEITCPYCDYEFITDSSSRNKIAIRCPKCKKIIQLDWHSEEVCNGECSSCESRCYNEEEKAGEENNSVAEENTEYNVEVKQEDEQKKKDDNNEDDM